MECVSKRKLGIILMSFFLWVPVGIAAENRAPDISIVVDVSGSMKENDPNNLRVPAAKLLMHLLPRDSTVGVFLLGTEGDVLIAPQKMDQAFRDKGVATLPNIHSRDAYTDIGKALMLATKRWSSDPKNPYFTNSDRPRMIILLTDGFVDVDKDTEKNKLARAQILQTWLPKLKGNTEKNRIKIYTIALSAKADQSLLSTLASETGGFYTAISNANALEKSFASVFENAVEQNQVPLSKGQFTIDASTEEFTVMVFHAPSDPALVLTDPKGKTYTQKTVSAETRWFDEGNYALVTLKKPAVGQWRVSLDKDPANRVFIVSHLDMRTEVPLRVFSKEIFPANAQLLDNNQVITQQDFLTQSKMNFISEAPVQSEAMPLTKDLRYMAYVKAPVFNKTAEATDLGTEWKINIAAKGKTFDRVQHKIVRVFDTPLQVSAVTEANETKIIAKYTGTLMDPKTLKIHLTVHPDEKGSVIEKTLTEKDWDNTAQALIWTMPKQAGIITAMVEGVTVDDRHVQLVLDPILVKGEPIAPSIVSVLPKSPTFALRSILPPIPVLPIPAIQFDIVWLILGGALGILIFVFFAVLSYTIHFLRYAQVIAWTEAFEPIATTEPPQT